jgi:hypothetical protein
MNKTIVSILFVVAFGMPIISQASINKWVFDQNLSYGSTGTKVSSLQEFLAAQGLYNGPISGNFFGLTKNALVNFQKQKGIQPASGFFGPLTRNVVNALTTNITPSLGSTSQSVVLQVATSSPPITSPPVSNPSTPSGILCNGTYWTPCPTGQELVCTTDGIKPYCQVHPPAATAAQIAGIALLCSVAQSSGTTQDIQVCTDGTILNGYNTNAVFRSGIDALVQKLQQKLSQQQVAAAQQQANCNFFATPYNPSASPASNLLAQQEASAEQQACMTGTTAAWQQEQQQVQQAQTAYQLQQLQSSVDANTAAIQQQKLIIPSQTQTAPAQTKCTTQPWWDAGVLRYSTTCSPSY